MSEALIAWLENRIPDVELWLKQETGEPAYRRLARLMDEYKEEKNLPTKDNLGGYAFKWLHGHMYGHPGGR
jgi:hypothetical protein